MKSFFYAVLRYWPEFVGRLTRRRDRSPIDNMAALQDFVASRSAFVAQKTLYDYVKTRMGIRYPLMFEDDTMIASLNIAKVHVFAGCLSDLTVYTVGVALHDRAIGNETRRAAAQRCYEAALRTIIDEPAQQFSEQDSINEFKRRLDDTVWQPGSRPSEVFTQSPKALYRWAPIADKLKKFDAEIVENSIRFAWRDIREQFHKRLDAGAVAADWSRQPSN